MITFAQTPVASSRFERTKHDRLRLVSFNFGLSSVNPLPPACQKFPILICSLLHLVLGFPLPPRSVCGLLLTKDKGSAQPPALCSQGAAPLPDPDSQTAGGLLPLVLGSSCPRFISYHTVPRWAANYST